MKSAERLLKDERHETALAVGSLAALLWAIAVSVHAFHLGPLATSWEDWISTMLVGGLVCVAGPLLVSLALALIEPRGVQTRD